MHEPTGAPASANSSRSRRVSDLMAFAVLAFIAAVVCWPWLFGGQSFYGGDFSAYFWPNAHFTGSSLREGILPLWNPYLLSGTPQISNPQAALFYPANLLQLVLAPSQFLMTDIVLHLLLAGCGGYLLLRRGLLALEMGPSLLGATALMFGGFFVAKSHFPNMVQALTYVPLLLFLTEKVVQRPGERGLILALALALALQVLASNAQISVFTFYFMLVVALHAWVCRPAKTLPIRAVLASFAGAGALGLALSCVAWLPVFELLRVASRQSLTLETANRHSLFPRETTNFFWPHRFGDPMQGQAWTAIGDYVETACYAGIWPCLFALIGIFALVSWRPRRDLFWLCVLIFSIWLGQGVAGGLYSAAFYVVPGLNRFHDAVRLLLGAAIALPVLAAIGLQAVCRRAPAARGYGGRQFVVLGLLAACLTAYDLGRFARNFFPVKAAADVESMSKAPGLEMQKHDDALARGDGRILRLSLKEDPAVTNYGRDPYAVAEKTYVPSWTATLRTNIFTSVGLRDAAGYEPFARRDSDERIVRAQSLLAAPASPANSLAISDSLSSLSVRLVSVTGPEPLPAHDFLRLWKKTPLAPGLFQYLYINENFTPRARLSGGKTAGIWRDDRNLVDIAIPPAPAPLIFSLSDTPHPGWHAYLDGIEVGWRAQGSLRVVKIAAAVSDGEQRRLSFVFAPETFRLGLFISLCALGVLAGCSSWPRKCKGIPDLRDQG